MACSTAGLQGGQAQRPPCRPEQDNDISVILKYKLLKGQCHEMVIEMSPWSSSLGLNKTNFSV
jgi:hypothetical protein